MSWVAKMRVLVIEDEAGLRARLVQELQRVGFAADGAATANEADLWVREGIHDLIVLDLGLPGRDGLTLLKGWRAAGVTLPVLILTARDAWYEKVDGIEAGADDYLTKPYHPAELVARVRALLRRATGEARGVIRCGDLAIDLIAGQVTRNGTPIGLTAKEWSLLEGLVTRAGRIVSKDFLRERLYSDGEDPESNTVEVFVARLRRKLPELPIVTERGMGYRVTLPKGDPEKGV
ncbi:response regulator transcription factor [Hydrogenophilus thermoluteolus]|uniref:response regulator n=1 Tax=Hydrogenophilus thermoluteolus TaxID=297 RepID=UPI001C6411EB|nr:response regulator transcription factor [Hydrogenophilus thermoluteolus]MBW7657099.1 response regulator transcription factor [Hydrogenophilus thermoluteolus]GLW60753.1 DNA-binding response regulator [Hydrogenophilus thermoluteolus]HNQ47994.1 response regulator transcription factor [Hydrogenophilus thermoluteolus]